MHSSQSSRTTFKQTVVMATFMCFIALLCLYIIKVNLIDTKLITWDSSLGYMVMTAPVLLIVYSLIMLFIGWLNNPPHSSYSTSSKPQVMENESDWEAKDVHWLTKHL